MLDIETELRLTRNATSKRLHTDGEYIQAVRAFLLESPGFDCPRKAAIQDSELNTERYIIG